MWHRISAFASTVLRVAALGLGLSVFAVGCFANAPDWVQQAAEKPQGKYPAETNAVVLLDDTSMVVTGPGQAEITYRRVVRILRPQGREQAKLGVYLSGGEKLLSLHAWSIDGTGRQYELKEKEFADYSPFYGEMYSDVHYRVAEAPAGNPGSVLAFEYSVRRKLWMDKWAWHFQEDVPVDEARLTVQLPSGWEYKDSWANHSAEKASQAGPNRWQWQCTAVAGIPDEKHSPYPAALAGHMEMAFFEPDARSNLSSWTAIGDWYSKLTAGRRDANPELSAKAHELTSGADTFDAKLRALTTFLQSDVRYVAIEIGIGGYQPHPASDVYRMRYGDCKDKATLLSAMLKSVNIDSDYVLVNTHHGVIQPDVPSTGFNHAILAISLPPGTPVEQYRSVVKTKTGARYLIFDPTDEYTPVGELRSGLQGNYALLVVSSGGELIQLPMLPPDSNRMDRDGKFTLQADGSITGSVTERLSGTHASRERSVLVSENESERVKRFNQYLGESLKNASVRQLSFADLSARHKELVVEYQVSASGYAQRSGSLVLLRTRVVGEKGLSLDWAKRKLPVQLAGPTSEKDTFEVQLPPGYTVDDLPDAKTVDVGFASYTSKIETVGSTIRYSREYVVKEPLVSTDKLADLHKLENAIYDDESATAVLKKTP
jgi:hypothetical protein